MHEQKHTWIEEKCEVVLYNNCAGTNEAIQGGEKTICWWSAHAIRC